MIAPALIIFIAFYMYPIAYLFYLSTVEWDFLSPNKTFVGMQNFIDLLRDPLFLQVLGNTLIYTLATVVLNMTLGLLLALRMNRPGWFSSVLQGAVFSPYIISMVSVAILWMWLMDPQYGLLNAILEFIGLPKLQWLRDPHTSMLSLILVSVWKHVGFYSLVILAGLQSVPGEIYEAAHLDKTPPWRVFYKITMPMLSPTLFFLTIIGMINSFQVFETINIMTQGGPVNSTNTLVYYIYENGFRYFKMGYAAAAGVVLLVIIAVLTIVHFRFLEKRVHYR
jgi:sn-glycerol 3-phosphate transport system permease protein